MKTLRLYWGSWIIVIGPLEILNWCSDMLRMSTPEKKKIIIKNKKTARLLKSESNGPWKCLKWLLLQQESLLMLTAVLLWCHQFLFKWWKDSDKGPTLGNKPLHTSLQTRQGFRFIIAASGQGQQPVSPKLLLCFLCLLTTNIAEMFSFHWQFSFNSFRDFAY